MKIMENVPFQKLNGKNNISVIPNVLRELYKKSPTEMNS
jgi:hypothetical protein